MRRLVAKEWIRYTGRTRPTARKVATPHAVAWRLPRLLACHYTQVEIPAARSTATKNWPKPTFAKVASGTGRA